MKINKMKVRIEDNQGKVLVDQKLLNLPLKDKSIVDLSIVYFNDPEPCMIHRSAVMKRMFSEMYDWFMSRGSMSQIHWVEIPDHMKLWLDTEEVPSHIIIHG